MATMANGRVNPVTVRYLFSPKDQFVTIIYINNKMMISYFYLMISLFTGFESELNNYYGKYCISSYSKK